MTYVGDAITRNVRYVTAHSSINGTLTRRFETEVLKAVAWTMRENEVVAAVESIVWVR